MLELNNLKGCLRSRHQVLSRQPLKFGNFDVATLQNDCQIPYHCHTANTGVTVLSRANLKGCHVRIELFEGLPGVRASVSL